MISYYDKGIDDYYCGKEPQIDNIEYLQGYNYAESFYKSKEIEKYYKDLEEKHYKDLEKYYKDLEREQNNLNFI